MTTGQRIAVKRKELDLSQEGLGSALQVSRQSIYKWESDASLPEVDKLVALSRLFGVSVGWLLGVEESESPAAGELTEQQIKMVEEIVSRYRQGEENLSQSQQEQVEELVAKRLQAGKRLRRWPVVLVVVLLGAVCLWQNGRMEELEDRYQGLNSSISNLNHTVSSQIGSITNRVENILKAQNDLTADYTSAIESADLAANTVTFTARAVPRTYVEGMKVIFQVESGGNVLEFDGEKGPGREFSATLTCPLTDSITLSAVFVQGDTRQTQVLDRYYDLYNNSLPDIMISPFDGFIWPDELDWSDGTLRLKTDYADYRPSNSAAASNSAVGQGELKQVQVGLFKNGTLLRWLTPCEKPSNYHGFEDHVFYRLDPMEIPLEEGNHLCVAALLTDVYGRQQVVADMPGIMVENGVLEVGAPYLSELFTWEFSAS